MSLEQDVATGATGATGIFRRDFIQGATALIGFDSLSSLFAEKSDAKGKKDKNPNAIRKIRNEMREKRVVSDNYAQFTDRYDVAEIKRIGPEMKMQLDAHQHLARIALYGRKNDTDDRELGKIGNSAEGRGWLTKDVMTKLREKYKETWKPEQNWTTDDLEQVADNDAVWLERNEDLRAQYELIILRQKIPTLKQDGTVELQPVREGHIKDFYKRVNETWQAQLAANLKVLRDKKIAAIAQVRRHFSTTKYADGAPSAGQRMYSDVRVNEEVANVTEVYDKKIKKWETKDEKKSRRYAQKEQRMLGFARDYFRFADHQTSQLVGFDTRFAPQQRYEEATFWYSRDGHDGGLWGKQLSKVVNHVMGSRANARNIADFSEGNSQDDENPSYRFTESLKRDLLTDENTPRDIKKIVDDLEPGMYHPRSMMDDSVKVAHTTRDQEFIANLFYAIRSYEKIDGKNVLLSNDNSDAEKIDHLYSHAVTIPKEVLDEYVVLWGPKDHKKDVEAVLEHQSVQALPRILDRRDKKRVPQRDYNGDGRYNRTERKTAKDDGLDPVVFKRLKPLN